MPRFLALTVLVGAILQLEGCLYIPAVGGKKPAKEALLAMEPGATTRAEVLHRFGKPNALETDRFYVYEMEKGRGFIIGGGGGGSLGADYHRLLFEFDTRGVLSRWSIERAGGATDAPLPDRKPQKKAATSIQVEVAPALKKLPADRVALRGSKSFRAVALSPDGSLLAAADRKGRLWLQDLRSGAVSILDQPKAFEPLRRVRPALEISQDGRLLAVMAKGVQVVDPARHVHVDIPAALSKSEMRALREATAMAIDPVDRLIAAGDRKGEVRVIDTARNVVTHSRQAHEHEISAVAYSPNGGLLATAALDDSVRIWDTATWEEVASIPTPAAATCFSPDGSLALRATGRVEIWHVGAHGEMGRMGSGTVRPTLKDVFLVPYYFRWNPSELEGLQMRFSSDGRYLAAPVGSCVVYDTRTRRIVWRYLPRSEEGVDMITSWAFTAGGRRAAIATPKAIYWIEGDWQD